MNSIQIFYAPGISGDKWILDSKESKHIIRVLRMRKGTPVRLIDGKGNLYEGLIEDPDPAKCLISVVKVIPDFEKRDYSLHIAISPLKNPERFEWFVEKTVEIGLDVISPVLCKNTEKQGIKAERLNNIIISAMKQSIKAKRTILNEPVTFKEFIGGKYTGQRLIAHCSDLPGRKHLAEVCNSGTDTVIMIGPEGDFTDDEIRTATGAGFIPVHLGRSRLRSETAGIAACHSIYFLNQ